MARAKHKTVRSRINLVVHPETRKLVERLMERIHADSIGEVIRRALEHYEEHLDRKDRDV